MIRADSSSYPWPRGALLAAAALALLSGCTVGPDFRRPAAPPENSIATGKPPPGIQVGGHIADDWYRLFGSEAVDALVRRALRQNPDLQAARAAIGVARYQLAATHGQALPQLDGELLANRQRANIGALTHIPRVGVNISNQFRSTVTLSYDLDPFGKLKRGVEADQAAVDYARAQALDTYITLADQVVRTAFQLAAAEARIEATDKLIAAERRGLDLTRMQERVGTVPRAATLTAQAQLEGTEATLPALEQQRDAAAAALAALVGETPAGFSVPPVRLADFTLPEKVPLSLPAQLVRQRPDLLAAEAELHQASARIGIRAAQRWPDISLTAAYGTLTSDSGTVFDAANALWTLTGQITAPLFHGGALKAQENQAKTEYLAAAARYRGTMLNAFADVATALRAVEHDAATLAARRRALITARQALALSRDQFSAGAVDELQVLTAQREYRTELLAVIDARARRFDDVAALFHALGGGWWNADGDPVPALTAADYRDPAPTAAATDKPDEH
ncbi:MAG: efflux transporter outer membrane subunit [Gammaproteobacteria bacterium]|nr:efflux transporter outer membrane subunit [Gammaproteobacteria bacterium]